MPKFYLDKVIEALLSTGAHKATKFVSPNHIERATHKMYNGRLPRKGSNLELIITRGRPNFLERRFIKQCIKAGEKFPVAKIQLKFPPKKRLPRKRAPSKKK